MCQALILKYSNADSEQLLGVIPLRTDAATDPSAGSE